MKKAVKIILKILAAAVVAFLFVFVAYESPPKFSKQNYGYLIDASTLDPVVYFEDLFGNSFYKEPGKWRVYAVPPMEIRDCPVLWQYVDPERLDEAVSVRDEQNAPPFNSMERERETLNRDNESGNETYTFIQVENQTAAQTEQ